ncbi:MAG: ADP-ribosylation factor-like protein [Candidatus Hodarchaeales archaeon]
MSGLTDEKELASRFGHKIIIAGLSEAGKTAIKRIFFLKQKTKDVDKLGATLSYERMAVSIKGVTVSIVDLGGQRIFIKRFLSSFSPFIFSSVRVCLFVIDVSEKTTRNNSIQYFSSCVERLQELSPGALYFVFLHKNDLVRNLPNYESIHAQLKQQFQHECPKRIHFLRTTIYKPETVVDSFGRVFELALPNIAESDYVDGRLIGQIEEYADKDFTVEIKDTLCPSCSSVLVDDQYRTNGLICNFCGYRPSKIPEKSTTRGMKEVKGDLNELQEAMMTSLKESSQVATTSSHQLPMEKTPTYESVSDTIEELQSITDSVTKSSMRTRTKQEVPYIRYAAVEEKHKDSTLTTASDITISDTRHSRVSYLTTLYRIKDDEAQAIIDNNQDRTFENAAKAGVPVDLLRDVFLKHMPFLERQGLLNESFNSRLVETFSPFLKGLVKKEEYIELMYLVAKSQAPVSVITEQYLKIMEEERLKKQKELERIPVIKSTEPEKVTLEEQDLDIIVLSKEQSIGFTIEEKDQNVRLSFYQGNNRLSSTVISRNMSIDELRFMLVFETELPVQNHKMFANRASPIIHNRINQKFGPKTVEIAKEAEKVVPISDLQSTTVQLLGFPLIEGEQINFTVEVKNKQFQVIFMLGYRTIGEIVVPFAVTAPELENAVSTTFVSMLKGMVIPKDNIFVASQLIFSSIQSLKKKFDPRLVEQPEEDDSSNLLHAYLEMLDDK